MSKIDINLECCICFDPILPDISANTYILKCCKNTVHLECLQKWYTNKTNVNCFICNQYESFCSDLITPITYTNCTIIPNNHIENLQFLIPRQQIIRENYTYKLKISIFILTITTFVAFYHAMFLILSTDNFF
jgi:hypothetical protein